MASIDQLQIEITASSQNAKKAIDDLVKSLQNLNKQLGLANGEKLTKILEILAQSARDYTEATNATSGKGFEKAAEEAQKADSAMKQLVKDGEDIRKSFEGIHTPDLDKYFGISDPNKFQINVDSENNAKAFNNLAVGAKAAGSAFEDLNKSATDATNKTASAIETLLEDIRNYKKVISDMENGDSPFNEDIYKDAIKGYEKATEKLKEYKKELTGTKELSISELADRFLKVSEGFERLSKSFGAVADKGIEVFKKLATPINKVAAEYREKFSQMKENITDFQKHFQAKMKKVSDFWKRTMKTFTFMLVRKAITAIIKEVGNAVQSLAMYSNAMGTAFNTDLSNMVADFQYLGRSIVSVFAPLLNTIIPVIDAIVDRIATLISYIGMLFAALGGGVSFTKAKKNVTNYAESLDSASKSAKNLTMGIDELNILNEKSGGGSAKPYDGWEDAWEEVEIPDWIQDLSDKIKGLFKDLFEPIKRAWNLAKDYVLDGWKFMVEQMKNLGAHIWDDFMRVWKSDTVTHIFYNLFMILGDIERVIGFIAKRFDEAWTEGEKGYLILMNIAQIVDILVQHLRNVTLYMVGWASRLNFNPLLESLEHLTRSFKDLAEFVGQVFEDVMKNVVLKYIDFLIREGIPHLQETIANVIDSFDFGKIREDLKPVEEAFERLLEKIDIGKTNAIGNLGEQIAQFTNSEEFTNFMQRIADIMDLISAEDVEKILTGLGQGILDVGDALVKFVNSDTFMAFLEAIDKWLENATSEDIAGILEKLAWAIGLFKFGEFATAGLSGFFQFAGTLKSFKDIGDISTNLALIGEKFGVATVGAKGFSGAMSLLSTTILPIVGIIAAVVIAVYSLVESFGGLDGFITRLREGFERIKKVLDVVKKAFHFDDIIANLKDSFSRLGEKLGSLTNFWNQLLSVTELVITVFGTILIPVFETVVAAITIIIDVVATLVDIFGGLADVIIGAFSLDLEKIKEGGQRIGDAIVDGVSTLKGRFTGVVAEEAEAAMAETSKVAPRIAGTYAQDYSTEIKSLEGIMASANTETLANAVQSTDYKSVSNSFAGLTKSNLLGSVEEEDYTSIGERITGKLGDSLLGSKGTFEDANAETASSGASKFNSEYLGSFSNNTEMNDAMATYGKDAVLAFNKGIEEEIATDSTKTVIQSIFKQINETSKECLETLKGNLATNISSMISGLNFTSSIHSLFNRITDTITSEIETMKGGMQTALQSAFDESLNSLGSTIVSTTIPNLITTYLVPAFELIRVWFRDTAMLTWWTEDLLPWFASDKWSEELFAPFGEMLQEQFELFLEWWDESVEDWWNEHLINPWFTVEKWDEDIFEPLKNNIYEHFEKFLEWWDSSMEIWWKEHVEPYFKKELWKEQFTNVLDVAKEVFDEIRDAIRERINSAAESVASACASMTDSLNAVLSLIGEVMTAIAGFGELGGAVTFNYSGEFATGGFPSQGSLFLANEAGAELIGTVGGRTAVASNQEITGITDAVYDTGNQEAVLLSQLISLTRSMLNKDPIIIGDKEIAKMANNGQSQLGMNIIS